MNFRTTALLFGILIGVLWLFGLLITYQRNKLDPGFVLPTFAKDKAAEIATVEIERDGHKYVFFKDKAGWMLRLPSGGPTVRAEDSKVTDLIEDIKRARKSDEADVNRNLSQWGLSNPTEKVTLKKRGGGKEWVLHIGKQSPDRMFVYVNSSDRPDDVLAVQRSKLESVLFEPKDINKYRSQRLLDVSDMNARWVDLKPAASVKEGRELVLERGTDAVWRFVKPPYGVADYEGFLAAKEAPGAPAPKDPTGVRGLLNTLGAIRVEGDADFEPLGKPSFPADKAILRVDVKRTAEGGAKGELITETLLIGPKVEGKEQYQARLLNDESAVRVAARNVDILLEFTRKPDTLRSHDLAQIDTNRTDLIKVSSGKGLADEVTLYRPAVNDWQVVAPGLRHRADESTIKGDNGLLGALQGKGKVKGFFDVADEAKQGPEKDKELGFDSPTARVVVWTDGLEKEPKKAKDEKKDAKKGEKEAKKDEKEAKKGDKEAKKGDKEAKELKVQEGPRVNPKAKPALTLTFGKKAGDVVYVKREAADGSVARVSVPVAILEKVTPREGALAYLDHNISPFLPSEVARLELKLQDGKQEFVVEREPEKKEKAKGKELFPGLGGNWLLVQPKDFKDRPYADRLAVDNVLGGLSRIQVQRWVAKVEDKKALKEYGLDAPSVVATVTLKKKEGEKEPTAYTYQFGSTTKAEKGKPAGVYGVLTGGGDLKDIVFVTPENEVRGLKEAEFHDRTVFRFNPEQVTEVKVKVRKEKYAQSLFFQRKDRTWVLTKGPEEFTFEPARVDELVQQLSSLDVHRFVSFNKGPGPSHGLGNESKVEIELILDGKTSYTLKIGAPKDAIGYYAEASTLPRAVFLVPQPTFQGVVNEGVSYFSRKK
jgi:hypothetical protein